MAGGMLARGSAGGDVRAAARHSRQRKRGSSRRRLHHVAILTELEPDRLGAELPGEMPESACGEWEEFVALCDRLDAQESSSSARREESDRSAGCL